jgi:quinol monooxygenase YgiN
MDHTQTSKEPAMPGPFIFIATNRLKHGKREAERKRVPGLVEFIADNEPQLIAFNEYANEEGTEVSVVQVHRDAESMEFHMQTVAERAARAYAENLEPTTSIQVYGTPSDAVLQMLSRQAGAGVPLVVKRDHLGVSTITRNPQLRSREFPTRNGR